MKKEKKKHNIESKCMIAWRETWRNYSEDRRATIKKCRQADGSFKCEMCGQTREVLKVDHVEPVVPVNEMLVDWNTRYNRLWRGVLQGLCKICHDFKTQAENKQRREFAKKFKEIK